MSVFRVHHDTEYTVISNQTIRDNRMSLKTLGLFVKMLSLPPNWDFCIKGLATICKDGECTITSCLQELEELRYLKRTRVYTNGKISDIEYDLYEVPLEVETLKQENLNLENLKQENLKQENLKQENQDNKVKSKESKDVDKDKELSDEEFFDKNKNKKDIRTLMKWTNIKIKNKETVDLFIQWLKLMLANNKWQTLETYNSKIDMLYDNKGSLDVNDIIKDTIEKGYFSFTYSINSLNNNRKFKPAYQFDKKEEPTDKKFGVDRTIEISRDEVF